MIDLQNLITGLAETGMQERSKYHFTFGNLIDRLRNADDALKLTPAIVGISAYRGYYSDIALCTESGCDAFKTSYDFDGAVSNYAEWYKENTVAVDFTGTPKELADKLESLIGNYFDGYKGGFNEITREKPLWLASDYGDSSERAVIDITDILNIVTKTIE